jgi:RES domain-containing protein
VTAQRLDRVLTAFRIGDPDGAYPIFDATGSRLAPGRWNTAASPMIYNSQHYSTAMLEKLVRSSGELPPNQHFIEITIPNDITYEMLNSAHLPGWDDISREASRAYDDAWQTSRRSLLLLVPSVVARMARNVLINPEHAEFPRITHSLHQPVWWDRRLFGTAAWRLCRGPAYRSDIEAETPRWRGYRRWHVIRAVTFVKPSASGLR